MVQVIWRKKALKDLSNRGQARCYKQLFVAQVLIKKVKLKCCVI